VLPEIHLARVIEILEQAEAVDIDETPPISRDPKDDKFLATALTGAADYLVSEDQDLLVLGEYQGIPIITAARCLAILEQNDAGA
jgi:predicted nucleic acid-binding protein